MNKMERMHGDSVRFSHDEAGHWLRLKGEVTRYLASTSDHPKADGLQLGVSLLYLGLFVAAWMALLRWGSSHMLLCYLALSLTAMLPAVNIMHDAAHNAVFRNIRLNRMAMWAASIPLGLDADIWTVRHVRYHHAYANIEGRDLDIEPNPLLRQTPFQPCYPWFRWQHRYWPAVAAISLPYLVWYLDWADQFGRTPLAKEPRLQGAGRWLLFLSGKALHIALMLGIPWYALNADVSGWSLVACYLAGQTLASMIVVALILGTHWAETEFFTIPDDRKMPHTWYVHAIRTCCDWVPYPACAWRMLGGLNWHLTHHLFPGYSHRHYQHLAPMVARWARELGQPYRCLSYRQLWAAQQRFLRHMGNGGQ